jgi:hypothetical protein
MAVGSWAGLGAVEALIIYAGTLHSDHAVAAEAKRVVDEILTEYAESA